MHKHSSFITAAIFGDLFDKYNETQKINGWPINLLFDVDITLAKHRPQVEEFIIL